MQAGFLIKHEILKYRFVLQKDKSPFNFKSLGYVVQQSGTSFFFLKFNKYGKLKINR